VWYRTHNGRHNTPRPTCWDIIAGVWAAFAVNNAMMWCLCQYSIHHLGSVVAITGSPCCWSFAVPAVLLPWRAACPFVDIAHGTQGHMRAGSLALLFTTGAVSLLQTASSASHQQMYCSHCGVPQPHEVHPCLVAAPASTCAATPSTAYLAPGLHRRCHRV